MYICTNNGSGSADLSGRKQCLSGILAFPLGIASFDILMAGLPRQAVCASEMSSWPSVIC